MRYYPSSQPQIHKVFLSYHHHNDQWYKDTLVQAGKDHGIFIDKSVDTGDISDHLQDQTIRHIIRDDYLRDSTVTILLVGTETQRRKHVDWEIYSSMFDGQKNKKSGILVINLPTVDNRRVWSAHGAEEKRVVFPDISSWRSYTRTSDVQDMFPYMPSRIIENLVSGAKISVVGWNRLNLGRLRLLLDSTFVGRAACRYDLSTPMRRRNS